MAQAHYRALLEKILLGCITEQDPVLAMLEWVAHQMMLIEAEGKVGSETGKHSKAGKTYFSGARVRTMDTRLGTIFLYVPKLRKGGHVPFFATERKRSEMALAALVQEAFINRVSSTGAGEILAIEPMFDESEDSWREIFRKLKKRGLRSLVLARSQQSPRR